MAPAATARPRMRPLPVLDEPALLEAFEREGIKAKHVGTLMRHIVQRGDSIRSLADAATIPDFPRKAVEILERDFTLTTSRIVERLDAEDTSTTKLVIELQDGRRIESVIMRYGYAELRSYPEQEKEKRRLRREQELAREEMHEMSCEGDAASVTSKSTSAQGSATRAFTSNFRATLCVSSQVGCAMGCTFCATGTMGLLSNLCAGEILEQLYHANKIERIRNVVFMGMGEPLDNYRNVIDAIRGMVDIQRFSLSPARITVSTVGVVPRLRQLIHDAPMVNLALSLHAPTQDLRLKIVPTAKAWDVERIVDAAEEFIENQNERLMEVVPRVARVTRKMKRTAVALNVLPEDGKEVEFEGKEVEFAVSSTTKILRAPPSDTASLSSRTTNRMDNRRCYCMLEYVLLGPELNCSVAVAHQLGQLLSSPRDRLRNFMLNAIPYNPTVAGEPHGYVPPTQDVINRFVEVVRSYGVTVMVRQELGQDVNAACGQLVVAGMEKKPKGSEGVSGAPPTPPRDIEDFMGGTKSAGVASSVKQRKSRGAVRILPSNPEKVRDGDIAATESMLSRYDRVWMLMVGCLLLLVMRLAWKVLRSAGEMSTIQE